MNKKIIISVLFFLILSSGYINYRVMKSYIEQSYLLYDFNSYQLTIPLELVKSSHDVIPNIPATGLPLKMMKARYFMKDSIIDESLSLLYSSYKANPYLKIADYDLAKFHLNKKNMDSALYYSKNAFE